MEASDAIRIVRPPGLPKPGGLYSHAISVSGGRLLFLCGQTGRDAMGRLPPDFDGQVRQTYENIGSVLASEGLGFGNVVKLTTYLIDSGHIPRFHELRAPLYQGLFPSGDFPPNTLLVVSQLALQELLIEVEVVAAYGS